MGLTRFTGRIDDLEQQVINMMTDFWHHSGNQADEDRWQDHLDQFVLRAMMN